MGERPTTAQSSAVVVISSAEKVTDDGKPGSKSPDGWELSGQIRTGGAET